MCEIKPLHNEVIVTNNFRELEEAIDEISETENISNEREFFDSYKIKIMKLDQQLKHKLKIKEVGKTMLEQEINGEEHVLVPKDAWIKICEILSKVDKMGRIE